MIYTIRHRTTYTYERPVTFARCILRLTPQASAAQAVFSDEILITPKPSQRLCRLGVFGEDTVTVVIDQPHQKLVIEARSRVEVSPPPPPDLASSPPWETVRGAAFETAALESDSPALYLYPTRRTPILASITDYARESFPAGRPIGEAVFELMTRIHRDFTYDSKATDVSASAVEPFQARRGVCQDFSHVMISGLRGLGLPAAYVSGYLRTIPPPGQPRLEGADATHAWVSAWCGEDAGWIGFDPTNAILAREDHIILARGRDYSDVAPIDGLMLSPGGQTLKVEVDVVPATPVKAPRLPGRAAGK